MRIVIILLVGIYCCRVDAQFLNGDFEQWDTITCCGQPYEDPADWTTNNYNGFPFYIATTPVDKANGPSGLLARISSSLGGIDGILPGTMEQTIASHELDKIEFDFQCDSILETGRCVINLLTPTGEILYADSIAKEMQAIELYSIQILPAWSAQYDSLTLCFTARGYISKFDKEVDSYAIMLVDNVYASYINSVAEESSFDQIRVFPNPIVSDGFAITCESPKAMLSIHDVTGKTILHDTKYECGSFFKLHDKLPAGMYIVSVKSPERIISKSIFIQ